MASCRRTRSRPITASVTGCSTCRRVFISRKYGLPSASSRNSTVPAPTYSTARAAATAAAPIRARNSALTAGEGASSRTFWCRRWIEHSRSPRWTIWPWVSAKTWISMWRGATRYFSRKTRWIAERRLRLALRRRQRVGEIGRALHDAHPAPAAARRRLDQDRETDRFGGPLAGSASSPSPSIAGDERDARRRHQALGGDLIAHRGDRGGWWADPDQPRIEDGLGEARHFRRGSRSRGGSRWPRSHARRRGSRRG